MITHKENDFFAFSEGEYSDYIFNGLYRALKDLDLAALVKEYYSQCEPTTWGKETKEASGSGFGAWLIANGRADEVPYDEIHCGSYDFEVDEIVANLSAREV